MPIESRVETDRRLVITVAEGTVTADQVRANQRALEADPDFDPAYDHLFDMSQVTEFDVDVDAMRDLASVAVFDEDSRRAVVAPTDFLYGLANMYAAFRDLPDPSLRVFRRLREAVDWLQEE